VTIRHKIDPQRNLASLELEGALALPVVFAARERLCSDPDFRGHMNQLWDLTEVVEFDLDHAGLSSVIERQRRNEFDRRMRLALVAPHDAAFGLGRMYEAMTGEAEFEVGVFRDRPSALEWIETAPGNGD
jgi:hypothetical protein